MRDFFRRKPAPATTSAATEDRLVAALNGYTPEEWNSLSHLARVDAREHVAWRTL